MYENEEKREGVVKNYIETDMQKKKKKKDRQTDRQTDRQRKLSRQTKKTDIEISSEPMYLRAFNYMRKVFVKSLFNDRTLINYTTLCKVGFYT